MTDTPDLRAAIATVRAAGFRVAQYDDEHLAALGVELWNSRDYWARLNGNGHMYTASAIERANLRVIKARESFKSYLDEGDPELTRAAMVAAGEVK